MATHFMKYLENYCDRFVINKTDDAVMLSVVFGRVEHVFYSYVFFGFVFSLGFRVRRDRGVTIVSFDTKRVLRQKQPGL